MVPLVLVPLTVFLTTRPFQKVLPFNLFRRQIVVVMILFHRRKVLLMTRRAVEKTSAVAILTLELRTKIGLSVFIVPGRAFIIKGSVIITFQ